MSAFVPDRTGLVFSSFALVVAYFAVFDTPRFFRMLSFNQKTTFTRRELLAIRVPGAVVIMWITWTIVLTLVHKT